ncbi:Ser/Thr protein kinase RdoA (MazF antagonist) [Humibacillus xanthopallidus]|uniref:Ser/Thr protein kinase RdoA (MazF antagonist) n=1 Tax=Humibacillus xanthopallidus TaxID=412689 RepID=A0A543PPW9_9MICO|nr:phosphotransferase [Humibacillus xanthopallidus]TQN46130.1 Ser/Thr protein kinase RdoA (MazF antagonist) [Humibacillus xanthopallidus]
MTAEPPDTWLRAYAAALSSGVGPGSPVRRVATPSGALVAHVGDVVVKVHHPRTDAAALSRRLTSSARLAARGLVVAPLSTSPGTEPASHRLVTAWPRVDVLHPDDDDLPWAAAGALLARLHRAPVDSVTARLGVHGGGKRLGRALARVADLAVGDDDRDLLATVGASLTVQLREGAQEPGSRPTTLVHGDWHLGQLAHDDEWRLLDIDDLGLGDPAWDLGRPAGFWAAGLLDDDSWGTFLGAYRATGGPGIPGDGDPWPRLDLAARCAVFVAAVRELGAQPMSSGISVSALLQACRGM